MSQERYTGIVVLLLAALLFAVVIPLGIDSPNQIDNAALAPDLWPKIIVVLFGFTGVLLAVPVAAVIGVLLRFALGRYLKSPLYLGGEGDSA